MPPECTRHFLGWDQPTLPTAAAWILDRFLNDSTSLDLNRIAFVLPGSRAGRGLIGELIDVCEERSVALIPPMTLTPHEVPAALLGAAGQHASPITRKIAWIQALRSFQPSHLRAFLPDPPDTESFEDWMSIAGWIEGLSSSLCDAGLRMNEVTEHADHLLDDFEQARWTLLGEIQSRYESTLKETGQVDDRIVTLDRINDFDGTRNASHIDRLILVGVSQLGSTAKRAVELSGITIESLVFAPQSLEDHFDQYGSILTERWIDFEPQIAEERIQFPSTPTESCENALLWLANKQNPIDPGACVIGLADETQIDDLRRVASMTDSNGRIQIHAASGISHASTKPGMLVVSIKNYLSQRTLDAMLELIRQPAIEHALIRLDMDDSRNGAWWIEPIDKLRQDHVLVRVDSFPTGISKDMSVAAKFVQKSINMLLEPLLAFESAPLDQWANALMQSLDQIYQGVSYDASDDSDALQIAAIRSIASSAEDACESCSIGLEVPQMMASGALGILLDRLNDARSPEPRNEEMLESVGWLEVLHDPAPQCVVLGMSEACVPGSITHDPILPSSLRDVLKMTSNEDRLARDIYIISAINASREAVFMCPQSGQQGEPIKPSRVLFRSSGITLAGRVQRFVETTKNRTSNQILESAIRTGTTDLFRPTLRFAPDYIPPTSMRVTDFDSYLRSPSGWYLERVLNLTEVNTKTRELSSLHLGNLIHNIVESYGKNEEMRNLDDPTQIQDALDALLDHQLGRLFGSTPAAAVLVQSELLRYRLGFFANRQAKRRRDGWEIVHTEWSPSGNHASVLDVDGQPMNLRGKIDRIDRHESTNRWAVLDYKTGKITNPDKAHRKKDGWRKLQLPLYRHLVTDLIDSDQIELGYIGIPPTEREDAISMATWNNDDLAEADEAAREVVRQIRGFEPDQIVPMDGTPPSTGHLGFITGERFDSGGDEINTDAESMEDDA